MFNQKPSKIVQTNRLPFLIGLAVLLLVMGMFMYKTQMNQKTHFVESKPQQSMDISPRTADTSWFNDEKFKNIKIINQASRMPTVREIETQITSTQVAELEKREIEDEYATQLEIRKIKDKNKIEEEKLELEAMRSPLSLEVPLPPGKQPNVHASKSKNDLLTDGLNEMTNMVKSAAMAGKVPDFNQPQGKQAFLQKPQTDQDDYLEKSKQKPRSAYEVKAGSYIPAALITGINSDLPGSVNAQVTANVYDSVTGNYLLIPQGARLVGEYNSQLTFGQQRVQVIWNRIIFPDGKSIDLQKMQGVDIAGYTGFFDKVNNHYLRIYGNALLLSFMGAGYDILNQNTQQGQQFGNPRDIVAAHVGQKLSDVADQTLQRNMDVQPTLIIDPGYKFKVMVMKDMVLEALDDAAGTLSYSR